MKNSEIVGICDTVDWNSVIANLPETPDQVHSPATTNWPAFESMDEQQHKHGPKIAAMFRSWRDSKFHMPSIRWGNYYPGKSFPQEVTDNVAKFLKLKGVHRSCISKIDPGFMTPWHFDGDDQVPTYLKNGNGVILRFHGIIQDSHPGHIFILGENEPKDSYVSMPKGTFARWNVWQDWHAGVNAGITSKYLFHIMGY
jgi:hypothetical protein